MQDRSKPFFGNPSAATPHSIEGTPEVRESQTHVKLDFDGFNPLLLQVN